MSYKGFIAPLLALSILVGGAGVGYGLYTKNTTYTKEQYNARYKEGYDVGCKDSVVLKNQIMFYQEKIKDITKERDDLENLKEDYKNQYEAGLITIADYENRLLEHDSIINSYELEIERLNADLLACRELLENAGVNNTFVVNFLVDGSTWNVQIIDSKNTNLLEPTIPQKDHYTFLGWSRDGVNIVDITKEEIIENVTYSAIFQAETYKITFMNNGNMISTSEVDYLGSPVVPADQKAEDYYHFSGWTEDGVNLVDFSKYQATKDTVFTPLFEYNRVTIENVELLDLYLADWDSLQTYEESCNKGGGYGFGYRFNFRHEKFRDVKEAVFVANVTIGDTTTQFLLSYDGTKFSKEVKRVTYTHNGKEYWTYDCYLQDGSLEDFYNGYTLVDGGIDGLHFTCEGVSGGMTNVTREEVKDIVINTTSITMSATFVYK